MAERNAPPRKLADLVKVPDGQMTKEEKLLRYGPGNAAVMRYRAVERNGRRQIVHRMFSPGSTIPEGWEDSPAKFGLETEPENKVQAPDDYEGVVGTVDLPAEPAASTSKAKPTKAA